MDGSIFVFFRRRRCRHRRDRPLSYSIEPYHSIHIVDINKYKLNSTLVVTIPTLRVVTNGAPSEECEKEMAHKYYGQ
jgi:hypothetical protein